MPLSGRRSALCARGAGRGSPAGAGRRPPLAVRGRPATCPCAGPAAPAALIAGRPPPKPAWLRRYRTRIRTAVGNPAGSGIVWWCHGLGCLEAVQPGFLRRFSRACSTGRGWARVRSAACGSSCGGVRVAECLARGVSREDCGGQPDRRAACGGGGREVRGGARTGGEHRCLPLPGSGALLCTGRVRARVPRRDVEFCGVAVPSGQVHARTGLLATDTPGEHALHEALG